ncbi:MAG: type III-B CRISPR module RAMP protein Cmr6 [Isosphaeraceae bacterium]
MARGTIEFWVVATGQGSIRTEEGQRFAFRTADLVDLKPADLRRGFEVEFVPRPDGTATRVRIRQAAGVIATLNLEIPSDLAADHQAFRQPPVSSRLAELVSKCPAVHPGLRLDKYLAPVVEQEFQKDRLSQVVKDASRGGPRPAFEAASNCRRAMLRLLGSEPWCRTTCGPLTLHLARASMLENAGICLHSILGFPYLPGAGLKGMARAYAETVWLPTQVDEGAAIACLGRVFGRSADNEASSGLVVFHDAWPTTWPSLIVDIVNNHHRKYYHRDGPPGDWDSPNPVYFLAVPAGQEFSFALHKRRPDVADEDIRQARQWLDGALTLLGCGAKTTAGYGRFQHTEGVPAITRNHPRLSEPPTALKLRLTTPAYLAGAAQDQADCDLRSATLRGLLRWWWRTMHAAFLEPAALSELESLLWGDTRRSGIIQTVVTGRPQSGASFRYHGYLNYGMRDNHRKTCGAGSEWELRLTARSNESRGGPPPSLALEQALTSLWLLCSYGGVGSKGRKGYGSLEVGPALQDFSLERCQQVARDFREWAATASILASQLTGGPLPRDRVESPSLEHCLGPFEWETKSNEPTEVLKLIDEAYRVAAKILPRAELVALGLPRKGHRGVLDRHASPVHLHVAREQAGSLVARAIAFPSSRLDVRGGRSCRDILETFFRTLDEEIRAQIQKLQSGQAPGTPRGGFRREVAPRAPARRELVPPPVVAPKPINKGQDRTGTLHRQGSGWTILFEGENRPVTLINPEKIPPELTDGAGAFFFIVEANKTGIRARFERLPKA